MGKDKEQYAIRNLQRTIEEQEKEIFRLKKILNSIPGSVYWKDQNGKYLGRNLYSAEKMVVVNNKCDNEIDYIIGKTDYELFPKETAEEYRKHDLTVMQTGKELVIEETVTTSDNKKTTQLSTKKPLYDQNNNIVGVIGNTVDISHIKEVENKLIMAKQKAERLAEIKSNFISNMEHDIRTPFSGILGLSSLLSEQEDDLVKKEYLNEIALSAQELLNYCNSIIDFSKVEMEFIPITFKEIKLKELVEQLLTIERPAATMKKLKLDYTYDESIPEIVVGDFYRVQRILVNLISNAIKFTNHGQVLIKIELDRLEESKAIIRFIIEDTGIGIAAENIDYIFDKFYRETPSNRGYYNGIGLGLKVVKRFTEDLSGSINVHSKQKEGTIFYCTVPFGLI